MWKQRGAAVLEKLEKRKAVKSAEDAEKRKVRLRDKTCRWPHCKPETRLEVAHVVSKGMGGDKGGNRSAAHQLILLCFLCHQGPISLHSGDRKVEPLTEAGTDGACIFWQQDEQGVWFVVAQEIQPFVYARD